MGPGKGEFRHTIRLRPSAASTPWPCGAGREAVVSVTARMRGFSMEIRRAPTEDAADGPVHLTMQSRLGTEMTTRRLCACYVKARGEVHGCERDNAECCRGRCATCSAFGRCGRRRMD